ncbi:hypothetical protein F4780DRAFT_104619 [Xylariomycetidae sp. FL0641]|nr:hypothetical protein F4780DRAFT_104619 [Xylariomycetidae sp. FL0641]
MTAPVPPLRLCAHLSPLLVRSSLDGTSTSASRALVNPRSWPRPVPCPRNARAFSSCTALQNTAQPATPRTRAQADTRPAVVQTPKAPSPSSTSPGLGYARRLAQKPIPTTVYEVGPQKGFLVSSYAAGTSLYIAGAINAWVNVYQIPEGVPWWLPPTFGAVTVGMASLGAMFSMIPSSIIQSIKILPSRSAKGAQTTNAAREAGTVQLEVVYRPSSPIPGLPFQRLQIEPDEMVLLTRTEQQAPKLSGAELLQQEKEEQERIKARKQYEMDHLMTAPFRHAAWAMRTLFGTVRRGITGEGFAYVYIRGIRYKLDLEGGFALEGGQALYRLSRYESDPKLAKLLSASKKQM